MKFVAASYWDIVGTFDPGAFEAKLVGGRGQARRAGPRLRRRRQAQGRSARARRGRGAHARSRARGCAVRCALGRGEAVPAQPGGAVHDLDAAAGGEPQAALLVADDDARRPAALRERLHHLHAHRLDDPVGVGAHSGACAGGPALRGRLRPVGTAPLRAQGEERAGGARGDPPGGRLVPDAGRRGARAVARRACAVRARLEAHGRLADGGRARADGHAAPRRHRLRRPGRRVRRLGHRDHVPRLPGRVRGGPRRRAARRTATTSAACRSSRSGSTSTRPRSSPPGTRPHRRRATPRRHS